MSSYLGRYTQIATCTLWSYACTHSVLIIIHCSYSWGLPSISNVASWAPPIERYILVVTYSTGKHGTVCVPSQNKCPVFLPKTNKITNPCQHIHPDHPGCRLANFVSFISFIPDKLHVQMKTKLCGWTDSLELPYWTVGSIKNKAIHIWCCMGLWTHPMFWREI